MNAIRWRAVDLALVAYTNVHAPAEAVRAAWDRWHRLRYYAASRERV